MIDKLASSIKFHYGLFVSLVFLLVFPFLIAMLSSSALKDIKVDMQGNKLRNTSKAISLGRASRRERKLALQQDVWNSSHFQVL